MLSPREGCEKWKVRKTVRDLSRARFLKAEEDLLYLLEKCKDENPTRRLNKARRVGLNKDGL